MAFASSVVAAQTAKDILGIKLGQTPQEVRPLLQFIAQGGGKQRTVRVGQVNWAATPGVPASISALHATVGPKGGFGYVSVDYDEYIQVGFGQVTQKAFYVVRSWGSEYRDPTLMKDLEKGLLAKYGKPQGVSAGQMNWAFKADGTPATPDDNCWRGEIVGQGFSEIKTGPSTACGFTMQILYAASGTAPDVVYVFRIGMYDHRIHAEDIRAAEAKEQAHLAGQREKVQKGLGGKTPSL